MKDIYPFCYFIPLSVPEIKTSSYSLCSYLSLNEYIILKKSINSLKGKRKSSVTKKENKMKHFLRMKMLRNSVTIYKNVISFFLTNVWNEK